MTRRINYQDNIFYLNMILKQLVSGARLSIDGAIFADKIVEDLSFLDQTAASILNSLKTDRLIIDRLEYLKDLGRFNRELARFIEDLLEGRLPAAGSMENRFGELRRIHDGRLDGYREIQEMIHASLTSGGETEQIVSEEEFRILFSQDEAES